MHKLQSQHIFIGSVAVFTVLGTILVVATRAAPINVALESDDGTLTPTTRIIADAATSGGSAVTLNPTVVQLAPSDKLDLTNWKLTLPTETSHAGNPDEILQPELTGFLMSPYFTLHTAQDGVIFQAPAGGATTENSGYPRSELREMTNNGTQPAAWSNTTGTHSMTIRQAITHLPEVKPHVVAGQIHDAEDDVIMIRLEGSKLFAEGEGDELAILDPNYVLGTEFTVQITATDGRIAVTYNGVPKLDLAKAGTGLYFKAGCYTQSNPAQNEDPAAYGEVVIFDLAVVHSQ